MLTINAVCGEFGGPHVRQATPQKLKVLTITSLAVGGLRYANCGTTCCAYNKCGASPRRHENFQSSTFDKIIINQVKILRPYNLSKD